VGEGYASPFTSLNKGLAAVVEESLSRHEVALRGRQEENRPHQVLRFLDALEAAALAHLLVARANRVGQLILTHREARSHRVHRDPELSELPR